MSLSTSLNAFVERHPLGWNHDDWMGLLADLERAGVDVSEPAAVGRDLEKARLAWVLRRAAISGLGPKRITAIVDRFETLWALRQASGEDIAKVPSIPGALGDKVAAAIR